MWKQCAKCRTFGNLNCSYNLPIVGNCSFGLEFLLLLPQFIIKKFVLIFCVTFQIVLFFSCLLFCGFNLNSKTMIKEHEMLPLLSKFIKQTHSNKRRKKNSEFIKPSINTTYKSLYTILGRYMYETKSQLSKFCFKY